jgi:hypothetical protein
LPEKPTTSVLKKGKFEVLAVDLICSCAVKVAVNFREGWTLSAIAMVKPLAR